MTASAFRTKLSAITFMPKAFTQYLSRVADNLKPESREAMIAKMEAGESAVLMAATKATRAMSQLQVAN